MTTPDWTYLPPDFVWTTNPIMVPVPPAPPFPLALGHLTMPPVANTKFPPAFYTILRMKWRHDGLDDSRFSDSDIDCLAEGHEDHIQSAVPMVGALGDGTLIRWLQAHKELIQLIFTIGKMILPLLIAL